MPLKKKVILKILVTMIKVFIIIKHKEDKVLNNIIHRILDTNIQIKIRVITTKDGRICDDKLKLQKFCLLTFFINVFFYIISSNNIDLFIFLYINKIKYGTWKF